MDVSIPVCDVKHFCKESVWLKVNRKFMAADTATIGRKSSISKSMSVARGGYHSRAGVLADELGTVSAARCARERSVNFVCRQY